MNPIALLIEVLRPYLTRLFEAWNPGLVNDLRIPLAFFGLLFVATIACRGRRSRPLTLILGALATLALVHMNFAVNPLLDLLVKTMQRAYDDLGVPRLPASVWTHLPRWAVALIAAVAHDFANYWNHRLLHCRLLWPVHAIHHSEPEMSGLTTFRMHALEGLVMSCSYVVLLTWLSIPPDALGVLAAVLLLHNMYTHADLNLTHGPLELLVASPRFHRWHHADVPEARGKNLANVIPLLDVVFGTYYCPGRCLAPLGAAGVPRHDPFRLFLYPGAAWMRQLLDAVRLHGRSFHVGSRLAFQSADLSVLRILRAFSRTGVSSS
jgi:sterol desaturase/sphingolipid hydroxylase (fatty acid hydroxylase superfamily)